LPEAVVVLPARNRKMLAFQDGGKLLEHCLAGPDAAQLAVAIERLLRRGETFALSVRTIAMRDVAVRGRPVGDRAALFLWVDGPPLLRVAGGDMAHLPEPAAVKTAAAAPDRILHRDSDHAAIVLDAKGRLRAYNEAFVENWSLTEDDLRGEPHVSDLAATCAARNGSDAIWDIIESALASGEPERHDDWGVQVRADGRRIQLAFSRERDGGTTVVFNQDAQHPVAASV